MVASPMTGRPSRRRRCTVTITRCPVVTITPLTSARPSTHWRADDESPHEIARCTRTSAGTLMNPLELLSHDFMQRALLAALFTGLAAPAIGTFLVQRRLALLGDGIGHVALTGVAIGLLTHVAPVLTAVVVAVLGAVVIELLRMFGRTSGDVALAI